MSQPRRAAIVTPFYVDNDAVCNDVFHFGHNLRASGWEAQTFAIGRHRSNDAALPLEDLPQYLRASTDVLLYHFSTGCPSALALVEQARCIKVLRYHNITPPELFSVWCDDLAEATRIGRAEIPRVGAVEWHAVWGASCYNLGELAPYLAGTPRQVSLPPFHDVAALLQQSPPDKAHPDESLRVLFVGRIAPSKGHAFMLRVIRYAVHELGLALDVQIVGKVDHRLKGYYTMLQAMVQEYAIGHAVTFTGEVSANELARHYRRADVFLCTSDHEGFCVPLVEAMAFGVPIVALGTTAIPETVGDAGIVFAERDPRRFAVALKTLLEQPDARKTLAALGLERFQRAYSPAAQSTVLLGEMATLLQ